MNAENGRNCGDMLKVLLGFIEKVNVVCLFLFFSAAKVAPTIWSTRINVSSFIDKIEYESQFEFVGKNLPGERGGVDGE